MALSVHATQYGAYSFLAAYYEPNPTRLTIKAPTAIRNIDLALTSPIIPAYSTDLATNFLLESSVIYSCVAVTPADFSSRSFPLTISAPVPQNTIDDSYIALYPTAIEEVEIDEVRNESGIECPQPAKKVEAGEVASHGSLTLVRARPAESSAFGIKGNMTPLTGLQYSQSAVDSSAPPSNVDPRPKTTEGEVHMEDATSTTTSSQEQDEQEQQEVEVPFHESSGAARLRIAEWFMLVVIGSVMGSVFCIL